jgi:hypothetical protein
VGFQGGPAALPWTLPPHHPRADYSEGSVYLIAVVVAADYVVRLSYSLTINNADGIVPATLHVGERKELRPVYVLKPQSGVVFHLLTATPQASAV